MKIERLYPEVTSLYGEHANITYMAKSVEDCEIIDTCLNKKPRFLSDEDIDLVYMGTMTESAQLIVIEKLRPYKDEITAAIERGQAFYISGNALEIFGKGISDVGKISFEEAGGKYVQCLGIFDFHTERDMINRYNSLWLGEYKGQKIMGLRSQFTRSFYDSEIEPMFNTIRGPGFNKDIEAEGLRYKNFMASYTLGPIFIMNPKFMLTILSEIGVKDARLAFEDEIIEAYEERLKEYSDPNTGFIYD